MGCMNLDGKIQLPEPWEVTGTSFDIDLTHERLLQCAMDKEACKSIDYSPSTNTLTVKIDIPSNAQRRMYRLCNKKTGQEVYVKTRTKFTLDNLAHETIDAVLVPSQGAFTTITSADIRGIPLPTLQLQLTARMLEQTTKVRRDYLLNQVGKPSPEKKLPQERTVDEVFLALAANQFLWCEKKYLGENPTKRMAEINNVAVSTVQRWLAEARKHNVLMPVTKGRRSKQN